MPIRLHKNGKVVEIFLHRRVLHAQLHGLDLKTMDGTSVSAEDLLKQLKETPDETIEVTGTPIGAAREPGRNIEFSVRSFLPPASSLTKANLAGRFQMLQREFVALDPAPDIFLVPEYFFNWVADTDRSTILPSDKSEMDKMLVSLCTLSKGHPETLFVPGTIIWKDDRSKIRNSAHAIRNGEFLGNTAQKRYDKQCVDYDMVHLGVLSDTASELQKPSWVGGGKPYMDLEFRGARCRLEICADVGQGDGWEEVDLELVVSSALGAAPPPKTRIGGGLIAVDLLGKSTYRRRVEKNEYTEEIGSFTETRTIKFEVPDSR